jgi:hypothetical protein
MRLGSGDHPTFSDGRENLIWSEIGSVADSGT